MRPTAKYVAFLSEGLAVSAENCLFCTPYQCVLYHSDLLKVCSWFVHSLSSSLWKLAALKTVFKCEVWTHLVLDWFPQILDSYLSMLEAVVTVVSLTFALDWWWEVLIFIKIIIIINIIFFLLLEKNTFSLKKSALESENFEYFKFKENSSRYFNSNLILVGGMFISFSKKKKHLPSHIERVQQPKHMLHLCGLDGLCSDTLLTFPTGFTTSITIFTQSVYYIYTTQVLSLTSLFQSIGKFRYMKNIISLIQRTTRIIYDLLLSQGMMILHTCLFLQDCVWVN